MGVSVESAQYKTRIDHLRKTGAAVKFLSLEPLLGPLGTLYLIGVDWVIVGGESGPGARPMELEWVMSVREQSGTRQCALLQTVGWRSKKRTGRKPDGRTYDEMPPAQPQHQGLRVL